MIRRIGAQVALLAFGVAVAGGLYAGNPPLTVLLRALAALAGGFVVGQVAAFSAKLVLRDFLQKRKVEMDREHLRSLRAGARGIAEAASSAEAG